MNKKVLIPVLVVILVLLGAGAVFFMNSSKTTTMPSAGITPTGSETRQDVFTSIKDAVY
jgi:hypothetical protein